LLPPDYHGVYAAASAPAEEDADRVVAEAEEQVGP